MKLSQLQKYILRKVYGSGKIKLHRRGFIDFYKKRKNTPTKQLQVKIITQSVERLIEKGMLIGFGHKTQERLFIDEVRLTALGKKVAKELMGKQEKLPFKIRKNKKK